MDSIFRAVDANAGEIVWQKEFNQGIAGSPFLTEKQVIFSCQDGHVRALDTMTGDLIWDYEAGKWLCMFSSPVVIGNQVWLPYAYWLLCLDSKTGKKLYEFRFRDAEDDDGPAEGPAIAVCGGSIYYCNRHLLIRFNSTNTSINIQ
jgi:outer membrane protein assembly factor BamB